MNQLMTILPYWHNGTWVFDDKTTDLSQEPFVCGIPEIIDVATRGLKDPKAGFRLTFSGEPFPGAQMVLLKEYEEDGGNWYHCQTDPDLRGWLCPALFRYFDEAPDRIYVRVDECQKTDQRGL